jgi:hypothetical protein
MFFRIAGFLVLGSCLHNCAWGQGIAGSAAAPTAKDLYWIVEANDQVFARKKAGADEHALSAKYSVLRPADEILCKEPSSAAVSKSRTPPCALWYIIADDPKPQKLIERVPGNHWMPIASMKNIPAPKQLVKTSRELLEEMGKRTRQSGISKGSGCSGILLLVAPACRDTIDVEDFSIEWKDLPTGGTYASLFVETIDEFQPRAIRLDRIPLDAHHYENPRLQKFFEDVQKDSAPVSVVLKFSQSQGVSATRILTIPSRIDQRGLHEQFDLIKTEHALIRNIVALSVYVNFGLWSKAGNQARDLLALAPDEELQTYALIGLCQSGYSQETEELRTNLRRSGITGICPAGQP